MIRELFNGFIRIHILHHASLQPVYGQEMMAELARHGYKTGPGTIYPLLHRMAQEGYLEMQRRVVEGRVRKYYVITPAGQDILAKAREKLRELWGEVLAEDGRDFDQGRR